MSGDGGASGSQAEREFVSEAEEILERMREDSALLGEVFASDPSLCDPELVNRLFRSAHTLKGVAGLFGFEDISAFAHRSEDFLDSLRMGRRPIDDAALAALDRIVAGFADLLREIGSEGSTAGAQARVDELLEGIDGAASAASDIEAALDELDIDPLLLRALTEYEEHRLHENLRSGREIVMVETRFDLSLFEEGLGDLSAAIREIGEVISTLPSAGDSTQSQIRFSLLASLRISAEELAERLDFADTDVRSVRRATSEESDGARAEMPRVEAGRVEAGHAPAAVESLKSLSDTVRVDIRKLNELMTLVGELSLQRGAIGHIADDLSRSPQTHRQGAKLAKVHHALERQLRDLQGAVLDVRMVPLRQVFEKLSRVLRRLSRDTGKEVSVEFSGADTELDKLIVEELIDPLMHIVRNAFDHAIEEADERRFANKPPQGRISVEASQRGNHVVVRVSDDGRGIDLEGVRERAVERGLIDGDEALTRKELLDLIFAPGLSTRDEVSETSGRGVGMDVVRSNLTALGGIVEVDSEAGRGTTITLTLPITLAIIQALLVEASEQRYAIPLNAVLETLYVPASEIQRSEGRTLLDLRGEPLVLQALTAVLGLDAAGPLPDKLYVVVLGLGELRLGLVVDALLGQQDAVIKPIQGPMRQIPGIAGATELGDGVAVLVLDVPGVVEDSLRRREAA